MQNTDLDLKVAIQVVRQERLNRVNTGANYFMYYGDLLPVFGCMDQSRTTQMVLIRGSIDQATPA